MQPDKSRCEPRRPDLGARLYGRCPPSPGSGIPFSRGCDARRMSFDAVNTNYMTHQSSTARKTITDQSPTGVEWAEREGSERNSADPEKYESLLTNEFMRCRASWVQASRPRKEFSTTGLERGGSFRSRHGFVCVGGRPGEMNGSDKTKGRQIAEGEVPKRPTGADCKSAGICLRRFESSPLHQPSDQLGEKFSRGNSSVG